MLYNGLYYGVYNGVYRIYRCTYSGKDRRGGKGGGGGRGERREEREERESNGYIVLCENMKVHCFIIASSFPCFLFHSFIPLSFVYFIHFSLTAELLNIDLTI